MKTPAKTRTVTVDGERYTFEVPGRMSFLAKVWRWLLLDVGDLLCGGRRPWPRFPYGADPECLECGTKYLLDTEVAWVKLNHNPTYYSVHRSCGGDVYVRAMSRRPD